MPEAFDSVAAMAQRAWDEICIVRTLSRVAHAQDNLDPVAYRACFTDRVMLREALMFPNWQPKEIPAEELTEMTFAVLSKIDAVHHMVFNHIIDVDGDEASCVADLHAISVLNDGDDTLSSTSGGRYHLRLRREKGEWLICERAVRQRYRLGDKTLGAKAAARNSARLAAAVSE